MTTTLTIILAILTVVIVVVAIISCIVPPLPGPIVAFLALLSFEAIPGIDGFSLWAYLFWAAAVAGATVADFLVPPAATRKFGGTRGGIWGGATGAIAGLFFPPLGIILGPLVGAIVGDLLGGNRFRAALKSGFGNFVGFLSATLLKIAVCCGIGAAIAWKGAGELISLFC